MKRILGLVVLLGLAGADAALAKAVATNGPRPLHHQSALLALAGSHSHASRIGHRHKAYAHGLSKGHALTAAIQKTQPQTDAAAYREADLSGPADHPGWFKGKREAGWGFSNGRAEAMAGLYQRPGQPDIPGNQVYHQEGRGAAGLSLSLKLGH